jgi:hypothetical protein
LSLWGSAAHKSNPIKQTAKQINQICHNLISNQTNRKLRFEITFDIFDTGYKVGDMTRRADERVFAAYPEPDDAKSWRANLTNQSRYPDPPLVNYTR